MADGKREQSTRPPFLELGLPCQHDDMLLTVEVPRWQLEESGRVLSIGDHVKSWLTFEEAQRRAPEAGRYNLIHGCAVPLGPWPGAEFGRHPTRIDVEGGALYWDAPQRVAGRLDVAGTISTNNVDAPEGFPETSGVVRRVRMVWSDFNKSPKEGVWLSAGEEPSYEDARSTYIPEAEAKPHTPLLAGSRKTRWTAALIDLDTGGIAAP